MFAPPPRPSAMRPRHQPRLRRRHREGHGQGARDRYGRQASWPGRRPPPCTVAPRRSPPPSARCRRRPGSSRHPPTRRSPFAPSAPVKQAAVQQDADGAAGRRRSACSRWRRCWPPRRVHRRRHQIASRRARWPRHRRRPRRLDHHGDADHVEHVDDDHHDTPTTPAAPIAGVSGTDAQGFVGHSARCDAGSSPAAAIRTANSLAIICERRRAATTTAANGCATAPTCSWRTRCPRAVDSTRSTRPTARATRCAPAS